VTSAWAGAPAGLEVGFRGGLSLLQHDEFPCVNALCCLEANQIDPGGHRSAPVIARVPGKSMSAGLHVSVNEHSNAATRNVIDAERTFSLLN